MNPECRVAFMWGMAVGMAFSMIILYLMAVYRHHMIMRESAKKYTGPLSGTWTAEVVEECIAEARANLKRKNQ